MSRRIRAASHPIQVRKANLSLIAQTAMRLGGPFTRADLARETELSAPTIASLVTELVGVGLLREIGRRQTRAGRSPSLLEFNARFGFLVGIHVGRVRTRLAATDLRHELIAQRFVNTTTTPTTRSPSLTLRGLAENIYELLADNQIPSDSLIAVGVGVPGVVNEDTGVIVAAPTLPGWADVPASEVLQGVLRAEVVVANDVHLALLAEHARGAARGHARCALVSVGTDLSAAVLTDGRLERGHSFMAGQIGSMWMPARGGNKKDSDSLRSVPLESLFRGMPSEGDPEAWIHDIAEAAERGRADARAILLETVHTVAMATTNLVSVVDPSIIVLGGPLFTRVPRLVETAAAVVKGAWRGSLQIVPSALGAEASLWGAVLAANKAAGVKLRRELWPHWPSDRESIPDSV